MRGMGLRYIRADILSPEASGRIRLIKNGLLIFESQGAIIYCGRWRKWPDRMQRIETPRGAVVIPGLIDCHTHLSQYHVRGRTGHTLMQWLSDYVFPAEASFKNVGYARKISHAFFRKLLANGVTTAALYSNYIQGAIAAVEAAKSSGIRAVVGLTLMDRGVPAALRQKPDQAMDCCRAIGEMIEKDGSGRIWFSVNPRFAPACSPKLMAMIGRFARETGCYVQTHLSENLAEIDLVKREFPGTDSYTQVYERYGLLGPKTLLAHCIHLSAKERGIVRQHNCSVVHCPSSNLFLHSGRFPLQQWRDYPKLCLGTDVGAGPSFSMLDTMRDAYFVNQELPEYLFYLAILGGARALGLEDRIGSLTMGRQADLSVVTVGDMKRRTLRELLSDLIFKWDQVKFHRVFVAGREVFRSEEG